MKVSNVYNLQHARFIQLCGRHLRDSLTKTPLDRLHFDIHILNDDFSIDVDRYHAEGGVRIEDLDGLLFLPFVGVCALVRKYLMVGLELTRVEVMYEQGFPTRYRFVTRDEPSTELTVYRSMYQYPLKQRTYVS